MPLGCLLEPVRLDATLEGQWLTMLGQLGDTADTSGFDAVTANFEDLDDLLKARFSYCLGTIAFCDKKIRVRVDPGDTQYLLNRAVNRKRSTESSSPLDLMPFCFNSSTISWTRDLSKMSISSCPSHFRVQEISFIFPVPTSDSHFILDMDEMTWARGL